MNHSTGVMLHALIPDLNDQAGTQAWPCGVCGRLVGWIPDDTCTPEECGDVDCDGRCWWWNPHVLITGITPPNMRVCEDCATRATPHRIEEPARG